MLRKSNKPSLGLGGSTSRRDLPPAALNYLRQQKIEEGEDPDAYYPDQSSNNNQQNNQFNGGGNYGTNNPNGGRFGNSGGRGGGYDQSASVSVSFSDSGARGGPGRFNGGGGGNNNFRGGNNNNNGNWNNGNGGGGRFSNQQQQQQQRPKNGGGGVDNSEFEEMANEVISLSKKSEEQTTNIDAIAETLASYMEKEEGSKKELLTRVTKLEEELNELRAMIKKGGMNFNNSNLNSSNSSGGNNKKFTSSHRSRDDQDQSQEDQEDEDQDQDRNKKGGKGASASKKNSKSDDLDVQVNKIVRTYVEKLEGDLNTRVRKCEGTVTDVRSGLKSVHADIANVNQQLIKFQKKMARDLTTVDDKTYWSYATASIKTVAYESIPDEKALKLSPIMSIKKGTRLLVVLPTVDVATGLWIKCRLISSDDGDQEEAMIPINSTMRYITGDVDANDSERVTVLTNFDFLENPPSTSGKSNSSTKGKGDDDGSTSKTKKFAAHNAVILEDEEEENE